jgi:hypothetical protein
MSGKTGRKALIVFQFHRLPLFYIKSPRGQEKSNKRPSLDCCSFKPATQAERKPLFKLRAKTNGKGEGSPQLNHRQVLI